MPALLVLLGMIALPLLEIGVFIAVGSQIGVLATLFLVVLAAVAGVAIIRRQSFRTLQSARLEARAGRVPAGEIVHGAAVVLAGLLLIVPGFVTDAVALLLLLPPVRDLLWRRMRSRIVVVRPGGAARRAGPGVVDLEAQDYERRDGDPDSPLREIEADGRPGRGPRPNEAPAGNGAFDPRDGRPSRDL